MSNKFFEFINLHNGEEDKDRVLENIRTNISFRGSNLWILACAIVIASVGLNVNSTAVIIGAMLISPLMGPIVGTGFALAIYDFQLLKKSGRNLLIATVVSLLVATLYFVVSPFKETQSELLARTAPNIYDVLIAFFGGLVGVIALTRVEKGNPIPGVAIATALMPPLCTAGYGLAIGNYTYFFGAFYLYSINCFFICISTFLIVKYLKYNPVKSPNAKFEKQIRYGITALIFIMIIPSFYLAFSMYREKKFHQTVDQYLKHEYSDKGYTLIYKNIKYNTHPRKIEIALLSKKFSASELDELKQKLELYNISDTDLKIIQDTKDIHNEAMDELGKQAKLLSDKDLLIGKLQNELSEYKMNHTEEVKEMSILFPEMKDISIGKFTQSVGPDSSTTITVILYRTDLKNQRLDSDKIKKWLGQRLNSQQIRLIKQSDEQ